MRKDSHEQCNCRSCERTNEMFEAWYMQNEGPISIWQFLCAVIIVILLFLYLGVWLPNH